MRAVSAKGNSTPWSGLKGLEAWGHRLLLGGFCTSGHIPEGLGEAQAVCTLAQNQDFCLITCISNYQSPEHVIDTTTRKFSRQNVFLRRNLHLGETLGTL